MLAQLVRQNNTLAVEALQRLYSRAPHQNLVFSPLSLTSALAMLYAGSRGETSRNLAAFLQTDLRPEQFPAALGALLAQIRRNGRLDGGQLDLANAVFLNVSAQINADYSRIVESEMHATVRILRARDSETMNAWISAATDGRIPSVPLFEPGSGGLTLVNALFLKQLWDTFEPPRTRPRPFHLDSGRTVLVSTMSDDQHGLGIRQEDGFAVLELGFETGREAMDVLLPDRRDYPTLASFVAGLTVFKVEQALAGLEEKHVRVAIPKLSVHRRLELMDLLTERDPWLPFADFSDFSGLSSNRLHVQQLVQDIRLHSDEEGVTAMAVTEGVMTLGLAAGPVESTFIADHPFVILIRDLPTGAILFAGVINNPARKD